MKLSGPNETDYHTSNGQPETHSVHSSQLSVQDDPLGVRAHNQQTSQHVWNIKSYLNAYPFLNLN